MVLRNYTMNFLFSCQIYLYSYDSKSRGCIQRETRGKGPYARADYNFTLSHWQLRSRAFHPNDDKFKGFITLIGEPTEKGRVPYEWEGHCRQLAENSAKKLKCSRRKNGWQEKLMTKFDKI